MSIFYHPQIDNVIIKFLNITDLAKLYQTNTYYCNMLKQYVSKYQDFFKRILPIKNDKNNRYILILQAVINNDIDICIYLFRRHTYTLKKLHSKNEFLFRTACGYGNFDIVKLLYDKMKENINFKAEKYQAYVHSYGNGHYNIAEFIHSKTPITSEAFEDAIILASKNGHFNQIISSMRDRCLIICNYRVKEILFINACMHGKLDFAKSLTVPKNKDLYKKAWCLAAKNMHMNVLEWLDGL